MNTSQELTRFLRGKGGSLDEKIALCNKLVHNELDVYLPLKEVFVLELVCDRLNDNKKEYTSWKLAPEVWDLLAHIVSNYPESSSRSLKRLRYVESIIAILEQGAPQIITHTLPVANFLLDQSIITADANSTQLMLALALKAVNTKKVDGDKILLTVTKIYYLPRRSARYKPAKKTTTHFFEACLDPLLKYLTSHHKDDVFDQLHQIFISGTFSKDSTSSLKENIGRFVKSPNSNEDNTDSIKYLFHYVVARSSKDIKLCEEIFLVLTENQKPLTNTLLETLSGANRVLSSSFFETLYSEHKQNHQLVGSLIDLDASLGVKHAAEIAASLTNGDEILLGKLFNAFIRVRDYSSFFLDIWLTNADDGGVWQSPSVIDTVAPKIPELTLKSLQEILSEVLKFLDQLQYSVLVLSILKGLLNGDDSRRNALRDQIVSSNLPYSPDWKVRYYCSIIYGDDIDTDSKTDYSDIYFFYTRFRNIELGKATDASATKFMKLIKKLPHDEQHKHLYMVFRRWPKILARHFEQEILDELLDLFLEVDGQIAYFEEEAEDFFEEKRLNRSLVACLVKKLKKHPKENMFKLGTTIPSACFERHERRTIIETLVSSPNLKDTEQSLLELISHVLNEPSFASNLETDITTLFSFIERFVGTSSESKSLQVFKKIWLAHTAQINDEKHWSYVKEMVETLSSGLQKKGANLHRVLCRAIFGTETSIYKEKLLPLLQDLFSRFINEVLALLKKEPSSELLHTLKEVSIFDRGCISITTLNRLASQTSMDSATDALNLFCLLCNIEHERFEQALHVLAVYTTLVPKSNPEELDSALCAYGASLVTNPDHFLALFKYILFSFSQDTKPENRYIYLRALSCLSNSNEPENDIIRPVVAILSANTAALVASEENLKLGLQILAKHLASVRIGQYSFELVVAFVTKVARSLSMYSFEDALCIYKTLTQIASALLLFHRVRMSSRHHLITEMFCALMEPLTLVGNKNLSHSSGAVEHYTRVMSNLCEPKFKQRTGSSTLNSASASAKRSLRKHLPVILLAFIHLSLNSRFGDKTQEELLACMSIVFDTISESELQIVNASLDLPGKSYMKLIYTRYKENYKWKTN